MAPAQQGRAGLLVLLDIGLGALIAWRITASITAPIGRAVVVAGRIARGDLTSQVEVRIHDKTGRLLEAIAAMQERLRTLVGEIGQTADSILVASSEVASGHLDLSQRIGHVSQSVGALEEMTQQNAALVEEGATAADSLKDQAGRLTQMVGTFRLTRDGGDDHRWGAAAPSASPMAVPAPTHTTAPRPLSTATSRALTLPRS